MEIKKENAVLSFARKYGYYMIAGVLMVAIGLTIALTAGGRSDLNSDPTVDVGGQTYTFALPMENASVIRDFSTEELAWNETLGEFAAHFAIDFLAGENDSVFAIQAGTVIDVSTSYEFGTTITVEHDNGYKSVYSSLTEEPAVKKGDKVTKGQKIGQASDSAANESEDGKHLHFEMFKDGTKVDPNNYLEIDNK